MNELILAMLFMQVLNCIVWGYGLYLTTNSFISWLCVAVWAICTISIVGIYVECKEKK